jgi:carbonic anhydrase
MKFSTIAKLILCVCLQVLASMALADDAPHSTVTTKDTQESMTPQQVLQSLKEGNERFTSGQMKNRDVLAQAQNSATFQHPVAVILNCMDSRTSPEIVFDQGLGDVFAIRIAGNIQNSDILGSMEFGTQLMGSKVIAVIGHTSCGAMRGACQHAELGNLTSLLAKIQPAVKTAIKEQKTSDCKQASLVDQIAQDNVHLVMKQIQADSPVIAKLVKEGKIIIVGGMQDLSTGKVTFFE